MIKFYKTDENLRIVPADAFERRCWVEMVNPTDDEVDDICELSGIPEEMLKAALDEEESARVDTDEGATMYVVDSPMMVDTEEGDSYTTIPVAIIYNNKCIVTVSLNPNPVLANFSSNRSRISTLKPVGFILNFMLENVKRFSYSLKQIDKKSLRLQAELHKSMRNQELIELLGLQDSLVYFSTSLSANSSVYGRLSRMEPVQSNPDYQDLYDDVLIETRQAVEMCSIYRDILKTTMDAFSSVISNNVNNVDFGGKSDAHRRPARHECRSSFRYGRTWRRRCVGVLVDSRHFCRPYGGLFGTARKNDRFGENSYP